jgi:hypothetical protein
MVSAGLPDVEKISDAADSLPDFRPVCSITPPSAMHLCLFIVAVLILPFMAILPMIGGLLFFHATAVKRLIVSQHQIQPRKRIPRHVCSV